MAVVVAVAPASRPVAAVASVAVTVTMDVIHAVPESRSPSTSSLGLAHGVDQRGGCGERDKAGLKFMSSWASGLRELRNARRAGSF